MASFRSSVYFYRKNLYDRRMKHELLFPRASFPELFSPPSFFNGFDLDTGRSAFCALRKHPRRRDIVIGISQNRYRLRTLLVFLRLKESDTLTRHSPTVNSQKAWVSLLDFSRITFFLFPLIYLFFFPIRSINLLSLNRQEFEARNRKREKSFG